MSSAPLRRLHGANVPFRLREARDEMTRSVNTVDQDNVSATLTVAAPADRVFAVLADPTTMPRSTAPAGSKNPPTGRR